VGGAAREPESHNLVKKKEKKGEPRIASPVREEGETDRNGYGHRRKGTLFLR